MQTAVDGNWVLRERKKKMEERIRELEEELNAMKVAFATFEVYWAYERVRQEHPELGVSDMTRDYIAYKTGDISPKELMDALNDEINTSILNTLVKSVANSLEKKEAANESN